MAMRDIVNIWLSRIQRAFGGARAFFPLAMYVHRRRAQAGWTRDGAAAPARLIRRWRLEEGRCAAMTSTG
jgi:hypothetical protein